MNTTGWTLTGVGALIALGILLAQAQAENPPPTRSETGELLAQVESLGKQVSALESRLAQVEAAQRRVSPRVQVVPQLPGQVPSIITPGRPGQQPRIDGKIEVNGWNFYLIPCQGR